MSAIPSIYINLEDDVSRIVTRLKREKASSLVLVCPKRCQLFSDSINLRLLKKQTDLLNKEVFILTMDERGQMYAEEAGFQLKHLPRSAAAGRISDVRVGPPARPLRTETPEAEPPRASVVRKEPVVPSVHRPKTAVRSPRVGIAAMSASISSVQAREETVRQETRVFPEELDELHEEKQKSRGLRRWLAGLVVLSLFILLALAFVVLPKAEVVVFAKSEPVTRDWEITVSTKNTAPDVDRLQLPAEKLSQDLEISSSFQSQGKREVGNKATGMVRIYNFTGSPLNLKAATTVLSIGGKNYTLSKDVSGLPPTRYSDERQKIVDEKTVSAAVEIVASAGGESYNAPAGTRMEITNQVFGSKPQFLYAKTDAAVTGGTSRFLSLVSEQDIHAAQNQLAEKVIGDLRASLEKENKVLLDKAYIVEPLNFSTDKAAGTESPSFEANLKVRVTGLLVNRQELKEVISQRIIRTLSSSKKLDFTDNNQMTAKVKTVDLATEQSVLSVHFEGRAIFEVELGGVAGQLKGKSRARASEILGSRPEIDKIDIVLTPSWQRRFPWFDRQIDVRLAGN